MPGAPKRDTKHKEIMLIGINTFIDDKIIFKP